MLLATWIHIRLDNIDRSWRWSRTRPPQAAGSSVLKQRWGVPGGGVQAMPGPPMRPDFFGSMLRTAMKQGMVPESVVTEKATRVVYSLAAVGALDAPPPTGTVQTNVSEAFPSYSRSILTEIYLCHPCSCHEILRREMPRAGHVGGALPAGSQARVGDGHPPAESGGRAASRPGAPAPPSDVVVPAAISWWCNARLCLF
jgi:hypothetical protein